MDVTVLGAGVGVTDATDDDNYEENDFDDPVEVQPFGVARSTDNDDVPVSLVHQDPSCSQHVTRLRVSAPISPFQRFSQKGVGSLRDRERGVSRRVCRFT